MTYPVNPYWKSRVWVNPKCPVYWAISSFTWKKLLNWNPVPGVVGPSVLMAVKSTTTINPSESPVSPYPPKNSGSPDVVPRTEVRT